jgi:hypothetical protein
MLKVVRWDYKDASTHDPLTTSDIVNVETLRYVTFSSHLLFYISIIFRLMFKKL